MKVFFSTTTLKIKEYYKYYSKIRDYLISKNLILHYDWFPDAYSYSLKNPSGPRNIKNIYKKVIEAINETDVSIIEYTVPNFSTSHQINYSILRQKPTLVLRLSKDNTFADSYIEAIESPFLTIKEYNLKNLEEEIDTFLGMNKFEKGSGRYNVILNNYQKYYLDWAKAKYKKSKSEIIRNSIDEFIGKDRSYKDYLKK